MYPYPFPPSVTPAVRTQLDAQAAFMNDMSKSFFKSFQQMCELNIQLAQTMMEETTLAGQQMMSAERQTEMMSLAAARTQPATEKLRAWQQRLSCLAADTQVDMARVTEQHVRATTRTARALADDVARSAGEDAERGMHGQQDTMRQFGETMQRAGEVAARPMSGEQAMMPAGQPPRSSAIA